MQINNTYSTWCHCQFIIVLQRIICSLFSLTASAAAIFVVFWHLLLVFIVRLVKGLCSSAYTADSPFVHLSVYKWVIFYEIIKLILIDVVHECIFCIVIF